MPLIDESTKLPGGLVMTQIENCDKGWRWYETYNAAHDDVIAAGFGFVDVIGTGVGSDEGISFNAELMLDDAAYWWLLYRDSERWFEPLLETPENTSFWRLEAGMRGWPFPIFSSDPTDRWCNMIGNEIWQAVPSHMFNLGLAVRWAVRYTQHRVAKTIQNAFCLDNRGRPLEE